MKTALVIITLISALSASPIIAADQEVPSLELRLTEADLSATLKQYEEVKGMILKAELQATLLNVGADAKADEQRVTLAKQIAALEDHATKLRTEAARYESTLRIHREATAKAQAEGNHHRSDIAMLRQPSESGVQTKGWSAQDGTLNSASREPGTGGAGTSSANAQDSNPNSASREPGGSFR